jgi:peptide/nickel transport system permease protein
VQLIPVLLLVTFFSFLLINLLPGDPAKNIIPFGTDADRAALRHDLHLDEPFFTRYGSWLGDFVTGDLGQSYDTHRPVSESLRHALPVSLQLMLYAQVLSLVIAVPLGVLTAYKAGSRFDKLANASAFGLLSLPNFVLALVLAYVLGVKFGWFPVIGYTPFGANVGEHFKSMFLPALSLAVGQIAVYMRLLRTDMIATLREDYIAMARSKGIPTRRVLLRHALRPSSLTLLTVAGVNVGQLIGGAVIIETIFQLPGMGLLTVQAILARQYVVVQSLVAVIAVGYVLVNFVVDLLYTVLDPRIRYARPAA